jgi:hypothetical protein
MNQGKYAKQTQVHKIRETNFVNLHFKEIVNPWVCTKFLHENNKVGRVTFFLKKEFIALFHSKISKELNYIASKELEFQKESSTSCDHCFPQYH